jgi:hypothetical protein
MDLFGSSLKIESWKKIFEKIDEIDRKFGKHSVYLGSSFKALNQAKHLSERGEAAIRTKQLFLGENSRQRLGIPMLGHVK